MDEYIEEDNDVILDISEDINNVGVTDYNHITYPALCSCGMHHVAGGNPYCNWCMLDGK
jgi:hypothetical protein